jgi:hypothetical protein
LQADSQTLLSGLRKSDWAQLDTQVLLPKFFLNDMVALLVQAVEHKRVTGSAK